MELNMRYATTSDNVCIAYAVAGQGLPVIRLAFSVFGHCQLEWRQSDFFERLCASRMIIPMDIRGSGLSDRGVEDVSLEARMLDVDAVAAALGLTRFAIHGIGSSGQVAVSYAVAHPDRVSHVILDDAFLRGRDFTDSPHTKSLSLIQDDWEAVTETIAFASLGYGGEEASRYAAYLRECTTQEDLLRWMAAQEEVDVWDLLPQVQAQTLILQHKGLRNMPAGGGREMAKRIPNARLTVLEGKQGDVDGVLSAIGEFLGDETPRSSSVDRPGAIRTVLFTDLVGHTEMMRRLGDTKGRDVLREHERITRDLLKQYGGTEVKTMGDGFMASFGSVTAAMDCAIALQRAFASHSESMPEPLHVRVGLNAGEPIEEDGDLFGSTVILASRIAAQAGPGEILVPDTVRGLLSGKGYVFGDWGEFVPKGFEDAVRLYDVRWRD
jgi:class 3 adenylate cyclase/pimeloyl-ACP methyl ester carboxylesterase